MTPEQERIALIDKAETWSKSGNTKQLLQELFLRMCELAQVVWILTDMVGLDPNNPQGEYERITQPRSVSNDAGAVKEESVQPIQSSVK